MFFLIASVVVYSSFIQSAYSQVVSLRGQLASEQSNYQQLSQTIAQIKTLIDKFQSQSSDRSKISLILPTSKDPSYLLSQIVGLAQADGVVISSVGTQILPIQPSGSNIVKGIGQIKADVALSGSYASFKTFLKQMETNILILDVNNLKLSSSQQSGAGSVPTLSYNISLTSYYQSN